jgi:hypothetical protein
MVAYIEALIVLSPSGYGRLSDSRIADHIKSNENDLIFKRIRVSAITDHIENNVTC